MYPGNYATQHPDRAAFIMAGSGETVTYRELEERANRCTHLLRDAGVGVAGHYSIFMENNARYVEMCSAGDRSGAYYTCVNSYLTASELAYILNNSESTVLFTSKAREAVARDAVRECPNLVKIYVVDGDIDGWDDDRAEDYLAAAEACPASPIADEESGMAMLYSSGTTGRPKGIIRPLLHTSPDELHPLFAFLSNLWQYRENMIYLSPAPLYHSAPQAAVNLAIRKGGTVIIMERFDPIEYLSLIEEHSVTHTQLVPTMFSRMLKMPIEERERFDRSSLEIAIHAAAPCPVQVKKDMIEWWGPIIHEYYGATEGLGFSACNSEEWLAHPGSVGKIIMGDLHVLDDDMNPLPMGEPGTLWFGGGDNSHYHNDPEKTAESKSPDGALTTVGDVGYIDDDGFLYLTDRKTFMIISGGVNIYPQETEDLLITHPKVADAAVVGVPNEDLGEEVKAVVQVMPGNVAGDALTAELIAFCGEHLSRQKIPRSIDYETELPRLPTGKLYKKGLRDRYWADGTNKII